MQASELPLRFHGAFSTISLIKDMERKRDFKMSTLTIEYPAELSLALGKRPDEAGRELRLMAALKLFESGRISSGLAAKLAGLSRVEFLHQCGQFGISIFQQNLEELQSDIEAASNACRS